MGSKEPFKQEDHRFSEGLVEGYWANLENENSPFPPSCLLAGRCQRRGRGFVWEIERIAMRVLKAIDNISIWSGNIVSIINPIVMVFVVYEIVMRFVFNAPTIWANEATVYLSAIGYLLGGAYSLYYKAHVRVDILYLKFSPRTKAMLDVVTFFFAFVYLGSLVWVGSTYAWESVKVLEKTGSPWNPPIYPLKFAIPVGGALLLLQSTANFVRDLTFALKGKES
jgi:TRAP-type mannitol/chloroaromatic compound transport system permease small subunit